MKKFRSKISPVLLWSILPLYFLILLFPILDQSGTTAILTMSAIIIPITALTLLLFYNTTYTITPEHQLVVYAGFFKHTVLDIRKIKSINKTSTIMSSPAASFDRIELHYGQWDSVVISPKDKERFIKALLEVNPGIEVEL